MAQRPFTARMFPFTALVRTRSYAPGASGGPVARESAGATIACNLVLAGDDKLERQLPGDGDAAGDVKTIDASFPADPGVVAEDTITPISPAPYAGLTLICNGPAMPVMRGAAFRVRCLART
jgi:hypothetical protein